MTVEEANSVRWVHEVVGVVVDPRWCEFDAPFPGMVRFQNRTERLAVLLSVGEYEDTRRWLHFSMTSGVAVPSWDQLVRAKEAILGSESKAIQVIAPRSEWVNIHGKCLHLFLCLDGDGLPDFTMGSKSL